MIKINYSLLILIPLITFGCKGITSKENEPLLLGRGVAIPLLIILIGAIGGMIAGGIIGMFVGAVILALAYQLFLDFMEQDNPAEN